MARILVTGAAGFIGSHLADRLLARGDEVIAFDNFDLFYDPAIKRRNLAGALSNPRFRLIEGDLRDKAAVSAALAAARPEKVVHLAAQAGVRPSLQRPQQYVDVNVTGTLHLLDAMVAVGCRRLVYGGTSSVYGASGKPPFRETDPADRPISPYAATKRAAELLTHTWHAIHGLRVTVLRFFTVYGPRQRPEMAIHKFARLMLAGQPIPRFGDGSSVRDYTYVDDILDGVVKSVDHDEGFGVYNLGESETHSLTDLLALLAAELGVAAIVDRQPDQPGDVPATCADITEARRVLGYDPKVPLKEGVRRFVGWLRAEIASEIAPTPAKPLPARDG
ncbi:MAG: SDR family NAD(P)-dependent oxidoreductase [Planctomycetes bacterium]|nr:SDR family NAD(P)-dependent oxidoreductase [Planctomycetota bacterium]